ncbi:hypothetical protein TWF506_004010 [Arthrobotrys conoides]|uniref:Ubiquitin-like domain-containing protein n=1 Tax=Arthrobotrys conoides TaxID=74498 RepID=A0AAN8NG82_9PEZI
MSSPEIKVTVGVVIPSVSSRMLQIPDVREIKDVLNRVSGMLNLNYNLMTAFCGGKVYREWFVLAEGDVVWITYPPDALPENLKESAAREVAREAEKPFSPRQKAALPIRAPSNDTNNNNIYQRDLGYSGTFIQRPGPVRPLPLNKAPTIDYLTGDLFQQPTKPFVPKGNKHWENTYGNYQNLVAPGSTEPYGNTGNFQRYPARPPPTGASLNPQQRWSIAGIDTSRGFSDTGNMFTKKYRKIKTNPAIRINFKFWTGQNIPLQLHPENRISTVVKSLIAMMKYGQEGVTPERLVFTGPNPNQPITLEDKMLVLFPDRPAEVDIQVTLAEEEEDVTDVKMDDATDPRLAGVMKGKQSFF